VRVVLVRGCSERRRAEMNLAVPRYLEALSAWTNDLPGWFANEGQPVPEPSWALFATILKAALVYE